MHLFTPSYCRSSIAWHCCGRWEVAVGTRLCVLLGKCLTSGVTENTVQIRSPQIWRRFHLEEGILLCHFVVDVIEVHPGIHHSVRRQFFKSLAVDVCGSIVGHAFRMLFKKSCGSI